MSNSHIYLIITNIMYNIYTIISINTNHFGDDDNTGTESNSVNG